MQNPTVNAGSRVEAAFEFSHLLGRRSAVGGEIEIALANLRDGRPTPRAPRRTTARHDQFSFCICWTELSKRRSISLRVMHRASSRLAAVNKTNFTNAPNGPFDLAGGFPNRAQFVVGQDARPRSLFPICPRHPPHKRAAKTVVADGVPIEQSAEIGEHQVRLARAVLIFDLVEQRNDIAARDTVDLARCECRIDQPLKYAAAFREATKFSRPRA